MPAIYYYLIVHTQNSRRTVFSGTPGGQIDNDDAYASIWGIIVTMF